ncbi:MAG: SMI1/KNR4 family protein [Oscillospiraceae bacterium]|nr:SMI1/KNR4 family protein [Oscillospiraceae bacterium]
MDEKVMKKLDEILDKEVPFEDERADISEIEAVEKRYGVNIPDVLKEFLMTNIYEYVADDWWFPVIEECPAIDGSGLCFIDNLYSSRGFVDRVGEFVEMWCDDVLPFADVPGGDYACIGVKADNFGKIYLLVHDDGIKELPLYLAAESFNDFILSFRYVPED